MTMRAMTPPPDTQPQPPTDALDRTRLEGELEGLLTAQRLASEHLAAFDGKDFRRLLDKAIACKRGRLARNPRGAST